jgi:hypothetical protein
MLFKVARVIVSLGHINDRDRVVVLLIGLLSPCPDPSFAVVLLPFVGHDGVGGEAAEQGISVTGIGYLHIGSDGLR